MSGHQEGDDPLLASKLLSHDSWCHSHPPIGADGVMPDKHEGFMLKKRKWPLKGWHKRFFVLDNGILKYSKSPIDIQKGKLHGSIDVGLSVMSIKKRARRIDLDTEEHIYHLKVTQMGRVNSVILTWRSVDDSSNLSVLFLFRSNLKKSLMPGCPSCVITGFTDRMRLCDLPGMPPCESS
uniref:Pleckstrin homology domain-containing protein n=1 Tax=Seriola lalandi dorsalis TaxID=1841481 RepID=A0A3B4WBD9_SERLL